MNTPDGLLLNLETFPPKGEIMRDLLLNLKDRGVHTLYLEPGRQFCWSFDSALKNPGAYPEEFFRGLLAIGESLDLTLIPVLSSRRIYEFIHAHPGTGVSVLPEKGPLQISIIQHLIEDMVEDVLSVFALSPCIALVECDAEEAGRLRNLNLRDSKILDGVAEAFEQELIFIEPEKCSGTSSENIDAGLTGITILFSERYSGFSLPALPAWLDLLPEDQDIHVRDFAAAYVSADELFNDVWRFLRQRWERRVSGFSTAVEKMREIRNGALLLRERGERLFHPEWFENEQRRWHYALYEAALHQFAVQPGSEEELIAVRALLDPVTGTTRYQ